MTERYHPKPIEVAIVHGTSLNPDYEKWLSKMRKGQFMRGRPVFTLPKKEGKK